MQQLGFLAAPLNMWENKLIKLINPLFLACLLFLRPGGALKFFKELVKWRVMEENLGRTGSMRVGHILKAHEVGDRVLEPHGSPALPRNSSVSACKDAGWNNSARHERRARESLCEPLDVSVSRTH